MPFELGRPLGVPGDAAWQTRVLLATLELLEAPAGPVLADFPDDAPETDGPTALVCPVSFASAATERSETERLRQALQQEITALHAWYDLAVQQRGRTTVGLSGLTPEAIGAFLGAFLDGGVPESPRPDVAAPALAKHASEDLKAYYFEAVTAQPGQAAASSTTLAQWFWRETTAGQVLYTLQQLWQESAERQLQLLSERHLVPRAYSADAAYSKR